MGAGNVGFRCGGTFEQGLNTKVFSCLVGTVF